MSYLDNLREQMIENDIWTLSDEGTWEEYVRPGGCAYGDDPAPLIADYEERLR